MRRQMLTIEREIASQPEIWRRCAEEAEAQRALLPAAGERIALLGCGTPYFTAQSIASLRESSGRGESHAFTASEFPAARTYDRVVAISRSGTTTEVVRALKAIAGRPTLALTARGDSPVTAAAQASICLEFADERAVVQTRFATAVLAFCRAWLGFGEQVKTAAARVETAAGPAIDATAFEHFVFLGTGAGIGIANEAALKMQESAGAWAEGWPAMEYRHGPISAVDGATLVWPLGEVDGAVLEAAAAAGATVVASDPDPLVELVAVQRAAVAVALARGRDPNFPPHLTRSVVLN
jgi:fructoselysine-6-P-deglycase FrlB-like protein